MKRCDKPNTKKTEEINIFYQNKPMTKDEKLLYSSYVVHIACHDEKALKENDILSRDEWLELYRKTGCTIPPFERQKPKKDMFRFIKDLIPHISIQ